MSYYHGYCNGTIIRNLTTLSVWFLEELCYVVHLDCSSEAIWTSSCLEECQVHTGNYKTLIISKVNHSNCMYYCVCNIACMQILSECVHFIYFPVYIGELR